MEGKGQEVVREKLSYTLACMRAKRRVTILLKQLHEILVMKCVHACGDHKLVFVIVRDDEHL